MKIYIPKYFTAYELVPPSFYTKYGEGALQIFVDCRIVCELDTLREKVGKEIIVNNWKNGGTFKYRGYRPPEYTEGARESQHRFGRAIDFNVVGMACEEVRQYILSHREYFPYITRIEADTPTWVHIDCMNTGQEEIVVFKQN